MRDHIHRLCCGILALLYSVSVSMTDVELYARTVMSCGGAIMVLISLWRMAKKKQPKPPDDWGGSE